MPTLTLTLTRDEAERPSTRTIETEYGTIEEQSFTYGDTGQTIEWRRDALYTTVFDQLVRFEANDTEHIQQVLFDNRLDTDPEDLSRALFVQEDENVVRIEVSYSDEIHHTVHLSHTCY